MNELVTEFLERFRKVKGKCSLQLPEVECASIAVNNVNSQLREKSLFLNIATWLSSLGKQLELSSS